MRSARPAGSIVLPVRMYPIVKRASAVCEGTTRGGCAGRGRTVTSVGMVSWRRRGQRAARTATLAGVAVRVWADAKWVDGSNESTGRDHRLRTCILGHQVASVDRSASDRSGGTVASRVKWWRWARRARGARVGRVMWRLGGEAWSKASQKLVWTSRVREVREAWVLSARMARAGVHESTE